MKYIIKIFRLFGTQKGETVQKYINKDRFSNIDYRAVENIENHFEFKNKQVLDLELESEITCRVLKEILC